MREIKQSTAANVMLLLVSSADHITGIAGETLTITVSKDGAAFASITPTVTDRGNGWYNLALTTSHADTLGDLALHISSTNTDPTDVVLRVIAMDKSVANTPANVTQWSGTNVAAPATAGYPVVTHKVGTGTGEINLSSGKAPATIAAGDIAPDAITAAAVKADAASKIAAAVEAAILNEGDATALLAAIAAKVEEFLINEGDAAATIAAIAAACNSAVVAGTVGTQVAAIHTKLPSKSTLAGTNNTDGDVQFDEATGTVAHVTLVDTVSTYTGSTPQTGDAFARLGAPVGASISADVAAVKADAVSILGRIGAFAGSGVNTIFGFFKAAFKKDASTPSDIGGTFSPATDSLEALQEEISTSFAALPCRCELEAAVTSSAGNEVRLVAWLEKAGQFVDLDDVDDTATCEITVREHDSGLDLFPALTAAAPDAAGRFEFAYVFATEEQEFANDRLYIFTVTIVENGNTWVTTHCRPAIG